MKSLSFLLLYVGIVFTALAQSKVVGEIIDAETGAPLEYATVSLLQPADSSLVSGGLTDPTGIFEVPVAPGNYLVRIQYVSYNTQMIDAVQVSNTPVDLGRLSLTPSTATLSEVTVVGQREQAVLELDRRVFNVGENAINAGRNASEVLDNLPSVSVDTEGNVSLRGSGNVRVLVNGKPSGLVGIGDTEGLRNLSGDMIERVEVITNPSSRYDAQGSGGIINIVLKKKRDTGLNGTFTANAGTPTNYGGAVNLNYGQERFNLFVNYSTFYRQAPGVSKSNLYRDTLTTLQRQNRVRGGLSHNFRVGTDINLGSTSTLTASLLYNISDGNNTSSLFYYDYNTADELIDRTLRTDHELEDEQNQEYELSYRKTFARKGKELTATAQYRSSQELENSDLANFTGITDLVPSTVQRSFNQEDESQWLLQADYVHPLWENSNLELGTRNTLRDINNEYLVEEQLESGLWDTLEGFTNRFQYKEDVYAFYAMVNNKTGRWSYQAGARAELSDIHINLLDTESQTYKNYINLFPSAALTYNLQEGKSIQGSYSRRINRPGFRSLNPFTSFSDTLNIRVGNPDLDPEYTDSYELGYLHNFTIGNIYAGGYHRHTEGVEQRITREVNGMFITRPENLGVQNAYGVEINTNLDLFSWWNINGNFNFYRAITQGEAEGQEYNADTYTMMSRFNSKWKVPALFNVQFNAFYLAPEETPQGRRRAIYAFDFGINRDILNKKATLLLSAQDLANTRKYRFITEGEGFVQEGEFQWRRGPQVTLTFTYRLNQSAANGRDRGQQRGEENRGGGMDEGEF